MPAAITATPAARAALANLKSTHGDIVLHLTGGCCDARTPLALDASDLKLGARDTLFGEVGGVKIYEMGSDTEGAAATARRSCWTWWTASASASRSRWRPASASRCGTQPDGSAAMALKNITATDAARDLLERLTSQHGPLRLQISGSYGVSVICLPAAELRLGARDVEVGRIGTTPVTMMLNEARYWRDTTVVIDVIKGVGIGFSIEGPEGLRFTLRKRADPALRNWMGQSQPPGTQKG